MYISILFDTATCFGCPRQPSSGKALVQKNSTRGGASPYKQSTLFAYSCRTWWWLLLTAETCSSIEWKPNIQDLYSCVYRTVGNKTWFVRIHTGTMSPKITSTMVCSLQSVNEGHITKTLLKQTRSSYIRLRMSAQFQSPTLDGVRDRYPLHLQLHLRLPHTPKKFSRIW